MRYIRLDELIKNLKFAVVCIFLLYALWFQYAMYPINGALPALAITMLVLEILSLKRFAYYLPLWFVFVFMGLAAILGIPFAEYRSVTIDAFLNNLSLMIPMVSIFSSIDYDKERLKKLFIVVCIVVSALSISLLSKGSASATGALVIGDLNSNVYSAFIFLGVMATLYLLGGSNNKLFTVVLFLVFILECFVEFMAASRRGALVLAFMLVTYIHSLLIIKYKRKTGNKLVIILIGVIVVLIVLTNLNADSSLVLVQRLLGGETHGDLMRAKYQAVAWEQFLRSPFWGNGLAAVQGEIGVYSHSLYYELLACTGIFGVLVLLVPLIRKALFFRMVSNQVEDITIKMESRTMFWSIIGFFLTGIAVVFIYDVTFYVFIGIYASYQGILETEIYSNQL